MKYRYESEAMQVIHEEMQDMHRAGFISDARMREFDEMCLIQDSKTAHKAEGTLEVEHVTAL